ncbi:hypothetical protein Poly51_37840 [Rubripirellula tenax]|uniref:Uncharacterized protein n=1 Tax=Rubripirellula tenax TaxID=2528015 RepID=A0A5C6EPI2_9BACT|nr:hypothetical protein Poly51_37840 [Rubripirellula tenax]
MGDEVRRLSPSGAVVATNNANRIRLAVTRAEWFGFIVQPMATRCWPFTVCRRCGLLSQWDTHRRNWQGWACQNLGSQDFEPRGNVIPAIEFESSVARTEIRGQEAAIIQLPPHNFHYSR